MFILENANKETKYSRQALALEKISNREYNNEKVPNLNYYGELIDLERFTVQAIKGDTLDDVVFRYLKTNAPEVMEVVFKLNPYFLKKQYLDEGEPVLLYVVEQTEKKEHRLW